MIAFISSVAKRCSASFPFIPKLARRLHPLQGGDELTHVLIETIQNDRINHGRRYTEDRDIKAAKTLLLAGEHMMSCTRTEHTGTSEERKLDFHTSYEIWKHSAKRPEMGKSPEAPSSSVS